MLCHEYAAVRRRSSRPTLTCHQIAQDGRRSDSSWKPKVTSIEHHVEIRSHAVPSWIFCSVFFNLIMPHPKVLNSFQGLKLMPCVNSVQRSPGTGFISPTLCVCSNETKNAEQFILRTVKPQQGRNELRVSDKVSCPEAKIKVPGCARELIARTYYMRAVSPHLYL